MTRIAVLPFLLLLAFAAPPQTDLLAQTRAAYAALKSYADTGTVLSEYGTPGVVASEKHTFRTVFRAPRNFLFEFSKAVSQERVVVWGDAAAFHSWWSTTGMAEAYPPGTGGVAFATMAAPTYGSLLQVASMVFPQAGLIGTLSEVVEARDGGTEAIDGHPCRKLGGRAQSTYGATGRVTNVRQVTIWIDAETNLVRRIAEDASAGGIVTRMTTTFDPRVNPSLDDGVFRFTPPK